MELKNFAELLKSNTYPGRGIMIGKTKDGTHGVISYFIMGRSENSRNRVFVEDGLGIKTKAFDESKLTDPSLIIYAPVRVIGNTTIVTNGDQTDTIYEALEQGRTFEDALRTRTFEPDAPNFTPRISGEVVVNNGLQYKLSILKSNNGNPESALRIFMNMHSLSMGKVILFIRIAVTETQFLLLKESRFVWQLRAILIPSQIPYGIV